MGAVGWGGHIIQRECVTWQWRSQSFNLYDFFHSRRTNSFRPCNFCFVLLICKISLYSLFQGRGKPCLCFFAIVWVICIGICLGENLSTDAALRPPFHCKGQSMNVAWLWSHHDQVIHACEQTQHSHPSHRDSNCVLPHWHFGNTLHSSTHM